MHRISPNAITLARIALIPVFVALLLTNVPFENPTFWAFVVFTLAAATDGLDGYLARSRGQITVLGIFLDPLADKLLVTAALVSLVQLERVSAWIALLIISREFAVTGLRALAASRGEVIAAGWLGKLKTTIQILMVWALIPSGTPDVVAWTAIWATVFITVLSGVDYFWRGREYLRDKEGPTVTPA